MDKISTYQSIFNCTREEAIEKANKVQKNYKRIKALSKRKKEYLLSILENKQMKICENKNIKKCLEFQGLTINAERRLAVKGNKEIEFTFTEFEILLLLAQNAGMVFSKEKIYNIVWKEPYFGDYNIVMSHIRNLREKIEDNPSKPIYIQTVWGVGYRFNKNLSSGL